MVTEYFESPQSSFSEVQCWTLSAFGRWTLSLAMHRMEIDPPNEAKSAPDFDLAKTLDSGQVFHWEKVGNGFVGTIGDLPIYV